MEFLSDSSLGTIGLTILLFAACWIIFYMEHMRPYTGYFLWTGGMLLVLFSSMLSKDNRESKS